MFSTKTAQYAWKNLAVVIDGRPIIELTDIEYKASKELEEIFGASDSPQFIGEGNKTYTGSVEMLQSGYEALTEESKKRGGDDITDLEVDIIVALVPNGAGNIALKTVVDRVVGCKFNESGKKWSQGSTHIKCSLPFKSLRIENQV